MAPVTPIRPMANGTLIEFFINAEVALTGRRLHRVEAAHADLLTCFAEQLPAIDPEAAALLRGSDRFGDQPDAAARVAPPARILEVLPCFLDDARWHGADLQDRRVRAQLAWGLAQWVGWRHDLLGSEPYEAVRMAVWRSRKAVSRIKADDARRRLEESGRMPPVLEALLRERDAREWMEAQASRST